MRIKQLPEDFVVEEISNDCDNSGPYVIVRVKKKCMNSETVAQELAKQLHIPRKLIGYAGTKDRNAITTQYYSIKADEGKLAQIQDKCFSLECVGKSKTPLSLGDLQGNKFTIVVRSLSSGELLPAASGIEMVVPNYFGEQRFGRNNVIIGRALVKKNFAAAATLLAQENGAVARTFRKHPTNPIKALLELPKHTLMLFLHAFQSWLWNETLSKMLEHSLAKNEQKKVITGNSSLYFSAKQDYAPVLMMIREIPMIGFGTELDELDDKIRAIVQDLLEKEQVTPRDFIIKQLQGLSPEGAFRRAFLTVKEFSISAPKDDELCTDRPGMKKQTLTFTLPKGSYATIVIEALYGKTREKILKKVKE